MRQGVGSHHSHVDNMAGLSNTADTPPHLFQQIQADPDSVASSCLLNTVLMSHSTIPKQWRNDIADQAMFAGQIGTNLTQNTEEPAPHTSPSSFHRPILHCPSMGCQPTHDHSLCCYNHFWHEPYQSNIHGKLECFVIVYLTLLVLCWWEHTLGSEGPSGMAFWFCTSSSKCDLPGCVFLLQLASFLYSIMGGCTHKPLYVHP